MANDEKREKLDENKLRDAALAGAAGEVVQRYGSAVKEHLVAYSGVDNETGKQLTKGLKSISESKLNEKYRDSNIKQQAGFSSEVKTTARRNAESIIDRSSKRTSRTDDLGSVNDQLHDLVDLDAQGNIIAGSGSQMKFVGASPNALLDKLNSSKFKKYLDANALLDIADDDYDALMGINGQTGIIDKRIQDLKTQVEKLQENGRTETAAKKQAQIDKYKEIKKNLRKTGMTREEAIEARLHPGLSTAKDIGKIAHRAGVDEVKIGAVVSGSVSLVKNLVAYAKGDKSAEEVASSVVVDTGKGAAVSYATAFSGSVVKGFMKNSRSSLMQDIADTNLPAHFVTATVSICKTMHSFIQGDIDGAECIEQLGQDSFAEIGSAMFATAGASLGGESVALTFVGGLAGATLGYAAAAAIYKELSTALKEAKLARIERIRIEGECDEAIKLILEYRKEMQEQVSKYLSKKISVFNSGFAEMDRAICENDINGFIKGNNDIQRLLGNDIQFENQGEFDVLMASDIAFKL